MRFLSRYAVYQIYVHFWALEKYRISCTSREICSKSKRLQRPTLCGYRYTILTNLNFKLSQPCFGLLQNENATSKSDDTKNRIHRVHITLYIVTVRSNSWRFSLEMFTPSSSLPSTKLNTTYIIYALVQLISMGWDVCLKIPPEISKDRDVCFLADNT